MTDTTTERTDLQKLADDLKTQRDELRVRFWERGVGRRDRGSEACENLMSQTAIPSESMRSGS